MDQVVLELQQRTEERLATLPDTPLYELLCDLVQVSLVCDYDKCPDIKAARRSSIYLTETFSNEVTVEALKMLMFEKREPAAVKKMVEWLVERLCDDTIKRNLNLEDPDMAFVVTEIRTAANRVWIAPAERELPKRAQHRAKQSTGTNGPFACLTD